MNRLGRWIDFEHGYRSMEPLVYGICMVGIQVPVG